jgi:lipopolysaccharide transport system permease protein
MTAVVFTIFFGKMAGLDQDTGGLPYRLFVYAGVLPWTFFATAIASAGNSVVGSERLITKIYFPRLAIPFAAVGAAVVDFCLAFSVLIAMMIWYRVAPTLQLLWVPVLVVLLAFAALGVGTLLAALNVAYRDFRYVIPFMVQLWMFATPSVYLQVTEKTAVASYPAIVRYALLLNPMTGLVASFRAAALGRPMPWHQLEFSSVIVVGMFLAGCLYFRKVEDSFADKI